MSLPQSSQLPNVPALPLNSSSQPPHHHQTHMPTANSLQPDAAANADNWNSSYASAATDATTGKTSFSANFPSSVCPTNGS
ncbi:hypothetical protein CRYUN_Cryun19dG0063200 [Craigia yunnanensis]